MWVFGAITSRGCWVLLSLEARWWNIAPVLQCIHGYRTGRNGNRMYGKWAGSSVVVDHYLWSEFPWAGGEFRHVSLSHVMTICIVRRDFSGTRRHVLLKSRSCFLNLWNRHLFYFWFVYFGWLVSYFYFFFVSLPRARFSLLNTWAQQRQIFNFCVSPSSSPFQVYYNRKLRWPSPPVPAWAKLWNRCTWTSHRGIKSRPCIFGSTEPERGCGAKLEHWILSPRASKVNFLPLLSGMSLNRTIEPHINMPVPFLWQICQSGTSTAPVPTRLRALTVTCTWSLLPCSVIHFAKTPTSWFCVKCLSTTANLQVTTRILETIKFYGVITLLPSTVKNSNFSHAITVIRAGLLDTSSLDWTVHVGGTLLCKGLGVDILCVNYINTFLLIFGMNQAMQTVIDQTFEHMHKTWESTDRYVQGWSFCEQRTNI